MSLILLWFAGVGALVTHEEAQCIMRGKRLAFFGDSVTRYCYFGFNYWLEVGDVPDDEYDSSSGNNDEDYDRGLVDRTWTDFHVSDMDSASHRQHFAKEFDDLDDAYTEFYFVQDAYYDSDTTDGDESIEDLADVVKEYDYIAYNTGIWNLKEANDLTDDYCGEEWSGECEDHWEDMFSSLQSEMWSDGAAVVWRATTCCGEQDGWLPSIEEQNDFAQSFMDDNGHGFVDAYSLFEEDDKDDFLFDDTHPNLETCLVINQMILEQFDILNGSPCTSGNGGGGGNAPDATYQPTYAPTPKPVAEETAPPTPQPVAAPQPTAKPTPVLENPSPTPVGDGGGTCVDDSAWHKRNDPSKNCKNTSILRSCRLQHRLQARGSPASHQTGALSAVRMVPMRTFLADLLVARATKVVPPTILPHGLSFLTRPRTVSNQILSSSHLTSFSGAWVADFYRQRCRLVDSDGTYAFEACPYACRSCSKCEDSTEWTMPSDTAKGMMSLSNPLLTCVRRLLVGCRGFGPTMPKVWR